MIHSLFIINFNGDIILEKHWKGIIHRRLCAYFLDVEVKTADKECVPPIIQTPHHFLFNILHKKLFFVAVCGGEAPPLFVFEFLRRVADVIGDYYGKTNETVILGNIVQIYEILDEMLDNGFPLATELNILQELVRPRDFLRLLTDTVYRTSSGVSSTLPTGQLSIVPWRRAGVRHPSNEAFFDLTEEIDAIIDRTGGVVTASIYGQIDCVIKLSDMPDLSLHFINPRLMDDVSLHHCVRYRRWEMERILSFVPPDGKFKLMTYTVGPHSSFTLPVSVRPNIFLRDSSSSRLDLSLTSRTERDHPVSDVSVEIQMPPGVTGAMTTVTEGRVKYEVQSRTLVWTLDKLEAGTSYTIKGSVSVQPGQEVGEVAPLVQVHFKLPRKSVSGLRIDRVDVMGVDYKPYKGVKYASKTGRFEVRT